MQANPLQRPRLALLAAAWLLIGAQPGPGPGPDGLVRADRLRPLGPGTPRALELVLPDGARWPQAFRDELAARALRDWPADRVYGVVHAALGVWLDAPLLARGAHGHAQLPVVTGDRLALRGRLERPLPAGTRRRVVLLVDASSSANAVTAFAGASGRVERIPVLEAELRAAEHLLERVEGSGVELGVVAFGEGTWPLVPPGEPLAVVRERLADFRREHPRGAGRTDTICALWTAREWLERAGGDAAREIVLLTDGDLPHSGRFTDCSTRSRGRAREGCEARRNRSPCPASARVESGSGRADAIQMEAFGRRFRRELRVSPVVFEADRSARAYRKLAERSGGAFVQVPSIEAAAAALPALVGGGELRVFAEHAESGERTPDLLGPDGRSFQGSLRLRPGANDVELIVAGERGPAARFRLRVYAAGDELRGWLAELRRGNDALAERADELRRAPPPAAPARDLEIATEP